MSDKVSAAALSQLAQADFAAALEGIFEHSPWVAERAWTRRPFRDRDALAAALVEAMHGADRDRKLALIRAHPELAGRAAIRGEVTAESAGEQSAAGLNACSPEEFARLHDLNRKYRDRFGFPCIIAVKNLTRADIIATMEARLHNEPAAEFEQCLGQIARIATLRLCERVSA